MQATVGNTFFLIIRVSVYSGMYKSIMSHWVIFSKLPFGDIHSQDSHYLTF